MDKAGTDSTGYGFLGIVITDDGGYLGGFLVLNANGRPLEFHCTTTVKPSRAQEILYGPTLSPYLVGEQIGATLANKAQTKLDAIFTNEANCYSLRELVDVPLLRIDAACEDANGSSGPSSAELGPHDARNRWSSFSHGEYQLYSCDPENSDQDRFKTEIADLLKYLDLHEPFIRVREAIGETLSPGRAA